ncbi:olfactory receptor 10A7-like [Sphaerodactylus townsendi]|uniref:olfactory receptor 10A7-like n=1 Tax=Sphaerodactylus townsendi TaxID=933632 RepID=UPI00202708A6|nr:olfactory receptor 10A7-like [Sphaerodactylus townsendi]
MKWRNQTVMTEFILVGFSSMPNVELLLFPLLLVMYIATVAGNILIIVITLVDPALQSPMYFFLRNLAFIEICFTLDTVPQMLLNLLMKNKSISFVGCAIQMYCFFHFGCAECFLLAAMSYDRHVAICNPLRYATVMNRTFCHKLLGGVWVIGILVSLLQSAWIFNLPFCGYNKVNHFFCDAPPVLMLVCTDTYQYEMQSIGSTLVFLMFPFVLILISYVHILTTILKMSTAAGRSKAFSTCSSHLIVVTLSYGSGSLVYLRPKSSYSPEVKKMLSLLYTIVTPMLNPIVYSLKNYEVRESLKRTLGEKLFL